MNLKTRIEKLEQDLRQLISDHSEAMHKTGGSNDDSNLQYHLGSAMCDVQECHNYLKFATEPKAVSRDNA